MKTINKKIILALLGVVMLITNISAQNDAEKKSVCDKIMRNSKYIFEGKIISSRYGIRIKTGEHTYYNFNSYLVQVQKVIKGNIQKGTIEIVEWAPGITYIGDDHMEGTQRPADDMDRIPGEAVYFSYGETSRNDSSVANTNSKSIEVYDYLPLSKGELVKEERGLTQYISTLSEFYSYISANYGIKIDSTK